MRCGVRGWRRRGGAADPVATANAETDLVDLRASCLSVAGDVARTLGARIEPHLAADIVGGCLGVLQLEPAPTAMGSAAPLVRRGAAFALHGVVEGCGPRVAEALPSLLPDLLRVLHYTEATERDAATRDHLRIALSAVHRSVTSVLESVEVKRPVHIGILNRG